MTRPSGSPERKPQLSYSELQSKMHDEEMRRRKAHKIINVLHHYLGRTDLDGLTSLDIGCSAGFTANELALDGTLSMGVDIDVPGIAAAEARFGERVRFVCTSGDQIPSPDESLDVVVFNHIYEHVVDANAVVAEIHRVLKPSGVAYLGLGNKYQLMEPHYRLPLLSWLPKVAADKYIKTAGKADEYYEKHRSQAGLKVLLHGFHVHDYTIPIVRNPATFGSGDQVGSATSRLPIPVLRALMPIIPTYIWVATKRYQPPVTTEHADGLTYFDLT